MPTPALITVVLATYNWPQALDLCLQSLAQQQDKHFEVVIADDGSSSDTADLIARHQSHFPVPLQHVWQPDAGFRKAKILNQAIAATRGDYLVFLDGDCLVQPDFMTQHRRLAQVGVMVTGSRILLAPALTQTLCAAGVWDYAAFSRQAWRLRLQGQMNKCLPLKLKLPDLATRLYKKFVWSRIKGCNMSAWRDDVQHIRGFDESLEGWGHEDADFVFRLQQAGVVRKSGSWATEVLHLWHPTASQESAAKNAAIVRAKILQKRTQH